MLKEIINEYFSDCSLTEIIEDFLAAVLPFAFIFLVAVLGHVML